MTAKPSKTAEIRAPSWLDRAGKRMFRQVVRQLPAHQEPLPEAKVDLISDFVEARLRTALAELLAQEIERSREYRITRKGNCSPPCFRGVRLSARRAILTNDGGADSSCG